MFVDPYAPTSEELTHWCSSSDAKEPVEDWDLIITDEENLSIIFDLASQVTLPHATFFLGCLYLFVGDAHRTNFETFSRGLVELWLSRVSSVSPEVLLLWKRRAIALLNGEMDFDYVLWCGHGYASQQAHAG